MRDTRGRLTITDVVYLLLALAGLAALYPAYRAVLDSAAHLLGEGEMLLFQTVLPLMIVIVLAVIYLEARGGMAR